MSVVYYCNFPNKLQLPPDKYSLSHYPPTCQMDSFQLKPMHMLFKVRVAE